ncbi:thymidine phosphorylase [Salpingoeca rosetta]|uniref:Thymidine phosphorylase n=1 Tax=Salpingoeca rosetta (strain ATCC 50818 / BSB-021) TaxID=946362 RepID=F2U9I2_SALR5|nr:thymidine phosphorylase [Salpingoeca rosetta]EGD73009.1 thymidine phosphorylase [Salpingoeca rosetta]|eukprot:XP_004994040.1 thymidine phosphorylase [Salpingoeca rosetta]
MDGQTTKRAKLDTPALLAKKRDGEELNNSEIAAFIKGVVNGDVGPDQVGAFLMAVYVRGMSRDETVALTRALMASGDVVKWEPVLDEVQRKLVVDKHSTGGVGDKVSLPLAPALIACGCRVPMISGRGLGHTGGTLDKLEAIPGYNTACPPTELAKVVADVGGCIVGQSKDLVPGDRILYHTRDVTSTVSSLPLIVGSIMSKKLSESPAALVLDVKVGSAAFMKTLKDAEALATTMVEVGKQLGVNTRALLTEMDCPIGLTVGNSLEVYETVKCLNGEGPKDLDDLVILEGGHLLHQVGLAATPEEGMEKIADSIKTGTARDAFKRMCIARGATEETVDKLLKDPWSVLPKAKTKTVIKAEAKGFVQHIEAMPLAIAAGNLGAGRKKQDDVLDLGAGIELHVQRGDAVDVGTVWATVHHSVPIEDADIERIKGALVLADKAEAPKTRLVKVIQ